MPLEVLIRGDIFSAHQCTLQYLPNDCKQLQFNKEDCSTCIRNRGDEKSGLAAQARHLKEVARCRCNRTRVGQTFIATLPAVETFAEEKTLPPLNISGARSVSPTFSLTNQGKQSAALSPPLTTLEPANQAKTAKQSTESSGKLAKV